ncbi:hypothetical protein [Gymnodinialimonas ulvae]|uniref:hypothetical protein n=1 Tax=Gymnodinialimonas ulvae TaxID=3126504 RepID=UPI0030994832
MPDTSVPIDPRRAWVKRLSRIGSDHGMFARLDTRHLALMVEEDADTLLVSFDRADRLWSNGADGLPLGFAAVPAHDVSYLSLMSVGRSWFRSAEVDALLQGLAGDGFFASFRTILLVAAGPDCGHAAARAAALMPGAHVLLARPAAAIGAAHAPFETRFRADRRLDPDRPTPFGPDALGKAASTTILFDPRDRNDAAQAALFRGVRTTRVGFPLAGAALTRALTRTGTIVALTQHMMREKLSPAATRAALRTALHSDAAYRARLDRRS